MPDRKSGAIPAPVSRDAAHPRNSDHAPDKSESDELQEHNAPHADGYEKLAGTTNDRSRKPEKS